MPNTSSLYIYLDEVIKTVNEDLKSLFKPFTALFTAEKPSQVSGSLILICYGHKFMVFFKFVDFEWT